MSRSESSDWLETIDDFRFVRRCPYQLYPLLNAGAAGRGLPVPSRVSTRSVFDFQLELRAFSLDSTLNGIRPYFDTTRSHQDSNSTRRTIFARHSSDLSQRGKSAATGVRSARLPGRAASPVIIHFVPFAGTP